VAEAAERVDQMLLERKPGMVGADRDAHDMRLYAQLSAISYQLPASS
jgi:hypothetical protein